MANLIEVQDIIDGPRNGVFKVDMLLDSSDITGFVIWDPAQHYIDPPPMTATNSCAIYEIQYAVQDGLALDMQWDALVPKSITHLEGRGKFPLDALSGLPNNALGATGKVLLSSQGWTTGSKLAATLVVHVIKTTFPN